MRARAAADQLLEALARERRHPLRIVNLETEVDFRVLLVDILSPGAAAARVFHFESARGNRCLLEGFQPALQLKDVV